MFSIPSGRRSATRSRGPSRACEATTGCPMMFASRRRTDRCSMSPGPVPASRCFPGIESPKALSLPAGSRSAAGAGLLSMTRPFHTLDVFTETPLAGNPLAVVFDAPGLDDARMQAIAAEFNLSETVFVFEPRNAVNSARVRIFTPKRELPFAGHPTIGAAALIADNRAGDLLRAQDLRIVLEEPIGDVVCVARRRKGRALAAYFELPRLPERLEDQPPSPVQIAASLGLELQDIGFDGHEPSAFSAGAPFLFVPVRSLDVIR